MKKYTKELEDGKVEYKTVCLKNLQAELKKPVNVRKVKRQKESKILYTPAQKKMIMSF